MDAFTENLLSRARERQKMLNDFSDQKKSTVLGNGQSASSEPNLRLNSPKQTPTYKSNSEGNVSRPSRQNTTRVSSQILSASPHSPKTLNIHNENFNMEIKVHSADNVRVEVEIEEQQESGDETDQIEGGLRQDAKMRLNRLGKLYAGGEDANISSPIHQTEAKFHADTAPLKADNNQGKRGLRKLADLAQTINQFEDDLTNMRKEKQEKPLKKSWKAPAPQPPTPKTPDTKKAVSPLRSSNKPKAPSPPKPHVSPEKNVNSSKVNWDKKVLDSLESQGFTRTQSNSRLVYKYGTEQNIKSAGKTKITTALDKENVIIEETITEELKSKVKSPQKNLLRPGSVIADKAALFESSPSRSQQKDPALLSVSERKALFEKNKGTALIPKAPFGMATPINSTVNKEKEKINKTIAPVEVHKDGIATGRGIASKVASLFQNKNTIAQEQIENNMKAQKQKDMDILLNRFTKPIEVCEPVEEEDDEDDDDDDDDSYDATTEETAMLEEKQPKIVAASAKEEKRRSSGNKRCSKADSPKVVAVLDDVKRIKVSPSKTGRLYPSLTDIESVTETENETRTPTPNHHSSFEGSIVDSDDANTSFGRDILRVVCKNQTPQKRIMDDSMGSDLSDVLDDMDDYIDEALAYNGVQTGGPTPPKQGRQSPIESSHSFKYKNCSEIQAEFRSPMKKLTPSAPVDYENLPTHVVDGDNILPLTHTVSFYRKQQTQSSTTPVRQISRHPLVEEIAENISDKQFEEIRAKQLELKNEVTKQEMIISQTSQALNLCNSTLEFMGSTEQVEAERVLLVATHRRQVALHELQRLEVENSLRPQRYNNGNLPLEKGTLTISKIVLPLKQKYVTALAAAGGKGHHVVCLVKYGDQVYPTSLVSTVASNSKNPDLELNIPGTIKLKNVYSDFTITFEVYCLQAQEEVLPHEVKYHIKKANVKSTPKKGKHDSRLIRPIKESPAGPQAVRSPTFALMGYVVFSIQATNKKQWSLNNAPSMSPLQGIVEMNVYCELSLSVEHHGFLTMFEDISGFGAWHRRWCLLKGDTLNYWKYPDDEKKTAPINSINLKNCVTQQIGPVSREICARLHTFLIETERFAQPQDKDSLVTICKGTKTVIRHLLSADTKEERIEWCNKFNSALAAIHVWG